MTPTTTFDNATEVTTINSLIELLKDLEAAFRAAADEAVDLTLKSTFLHYAAQRQGFAEELQNYAAREGAHPPTTGTLRQTARVNWMAAWSSVTPRTDLVILEACARSEDDAVAAYKASLEEGKLGGAAGIGKRQNAGILAAQERICALRNHYRASESNSTSKPG